MPYTQADVNNPEWLRAAEFNTKLKAAQFHLDKAAKAVQLARQRIAEAGDDMNGQPLDIAALAIEKQAKQVREQRNALHQLYQLEH